MTLLVSKNEIWKGCFYYEKGYPEITTLQKVSFQIDILIDNNSFSGTAHDEESKEHFDEPVKVKGFFEKDFISFIMTYPYIYYRDEDDKIIVDKSVPNHNVNYYGEFDETTKSYNGEWEITYVIEQLIDGDIEEVFSGSWE